MSSFKTLDDIGDVTGKKVLVRVDLNVPMAGGAVADDTRIRASVPCVKLALDAGAAVMVTSHLGRPKEGVWSEADSLAPVATRLAELLGREVPLRRDWVDGVDVPEGGTTVPLTVTESAATDAAVEPVASVTLEMTDDLAYVVSPDPVPAGPQVWKLANTGSHHAHHMVMVHIPDGVTADQIVSEFTSMMMGTPTAEPPLMAQFAWVAYAALQSGGQTTWAEFDLLPGNYAVICYIMDPMTEQPHVLSGMMTTFTVA